MAKLTAVDEALSFQAERPLITDIVPAALRSWGIEAPERGRALADRLGLVRGQQVLLVLIDGFGFAQIEQHYSYARLLRRMREGVIEASTVIPSTTAAAITAFGTGCMPGDTRMVGWSVKYDTTVTTLIGFENLSVPPELWQPQPTLFETAREVGVDSAAIMPSKFSGSGLTRAALRGTRHVAAETLDERIDAAVRELRAGTPIVYLYWSELDHTGHGLGVDSDEWLAEFERVDAALERLAREVPKGIAAIVTGDHGMINRGEQSRIDVANEPELAEGLQIIAGEGRAVHIHAATDPSGVLDRWEAFLGERATIVRGLEDNARVLGGEEGAKLVGDGVALMHGNWVVVDSRTQPAGMVNLIGVHGSISREELAIPILRFA